MSVILTVVIMGLVVACAASLFELNRTKQKHQAALEALQKTIAKPVPEITAQEILHDLSRSGSLLRITRIDPSDVYLRSPRESA